MSFDEFRELGQKIRAIDNRLNDIESSLNADIINRTIRRSTLYNPELNEPNLTDPTGINFTHLAGSNADAQVPESSVTQHVAALDHNLLNNYAAVRHFLQSEITQVGNVVNPTFFGTITQKVDAEDAEPTTFTKTDNEDKVALSGTLNVVVGEFGAGTVKVGDQTITESGQLVIADPITPGIIIKDTGEAGEDSAGVVNFTDKNDLEIAAIQVIAENMYIMARDQVQINTNGVSGTKAMLLDTDQKVSLKSGTGIDEFSIDDTLAGDSDDAVPTEQAVKAYVDNFTHKINQLAVINVGNGSTNAAYSAAGSVQMPNNDNNCYSRYALRVPDNLPSTAVNLKVFYLNTAASAYSVKWYIQSIAPDGSEAFSYNVLNADTNNDFPAGTAARCYTKTIALDDAQITAGDIFGVYIVSDALNGGTLNIFGMWLEA